MALWVLRAASQNDRRGRRAGGVLSPENRKKGAQTSRPPRTVKWMNRPWKGAGFDADGFAHEFQRDAGVDDLVFADGVEIEVGDVTGERVVLHVLDESELGLVEILNGEVDEDLLGGGAVEHGFDFAAVEADVETGLGLAIDDAGDEALATEGVESAGTAALAGVCVESLSFGHVICR